MPAVPATNPASHTCRKRTESSRSRLVVIENAPNPRDSSSPPVTSTPDAFTASGPNFLTSGSFAGSPCFTSPSAIGRRSPSLTRTPRQKKMHTALSVSIAQKSLDANDCRMVRRISQPVASRAFERFTRPSLRKGAGGRFPTTGAGESSGP